MTIYLNRSKAKTVDLKEHNQKYDSSISYKLIKGAPILVNVEGSYVEANDLPNLVVNRRHIIIVNQWLLELRNPIEKRASPLHFKWKY